MLGSLLVRRWSRERCSLSFWKCLAIKRRYLFGVSFCSFTFGNLTNKKQPPIYRSRNGPPSSMRFRDSRCNQSRLEISEASEVPQKETPKGELYKDGIRCCWRVATNYGTWTSSWLCCQGSWVVFVFRGLDSSCEESSCATLEPENHPFEKEFNLPNLHFLSSMLVFGEGSLCSCFRYWSSEARCFLSLPGLPSWRSLIFSTIPWGLWGISDLPLGWSGDHHDPQWVAKELQKIQSKTSMPPVVSWNFQQLAIISCNHLEATLQIGVSIQPIFEFFFF